VNIAKGNDLPEVADGRSWHILHYKESAKPGVMLECTAAIIPVGIAVFLMVTHSPLAMHSPVLLFALMFVLSVLTTLAAITMGAARPPDILISQQGILAPAQFLAALHMRPMRTWSDVARVSFLRDNMPAEEPDALRISFKSGGSMHLDISGMKHSDLRQLLIALQSNAPGLQSTPPVNQVKLKVPDLLVGEYVSSFTRQWEDDLADRFAATLFVPHKAGDTLQEGKYKIKGHLTFGGASAIYLAENAEGERVILKEAVLPRGTEAQARAKAVEMFEREAKLLLKLNSPRIARLLDMFVENDHHYLVIEYIAGTDLRSYVKEQGPQPEEFVLRWADELAGILTYLHDRHPPIIHRDISPDNIVVRIDGSLALIDFGAANELLSTATGTIVGKQAYIAPEQFQGKATPQSDIYGLGATLFFLSTGQDPQALSQSNPVEVNGRLSDEFNLLVARCTAMALRDRYRDAYQLRSAIEALL
jgi:tRNA A-37 threonylcarbamoyl transferase component Bud32